MTVIDTPAVDPSRRPATAEVWPDLWPVRAPDGRVLAVVVASAVALDLAMRSGIAGLAGALLGAVVAGGLLGSGRIENRRARPLLLLVPVCTAWLGVRDAEWLLALDVVTACGLLVIGASFARDGDPFDLTVPAVIGRSLHGVLHSLVAGGFLVATLRRAGAEGSGRAGGVVRGLLLGAPVVLVIGLLLASADPVFASMFRLPDPLDLFVHVLLLGIGGWGAASLLRVASGPAYAVPSTTRTFLGEVEAVTVLGALVAVFSAFTFSQVAAAIGGADYVRRTAGLSYAEHARSGFFQLLAVAALTLVLLLALRATVHVAGRRFVAVAEVAVVLTVLVVAGAVRRLWLYEQAYGLTLLRLTAVLFAVWIGVAFVLLGLSLAGVGRGRRWLVPAAALAGIAMIVTVGVVNVEAVIVRRNVERFAGTDRLDVGYLAGLSDDAVPALVDSLPLLPADQADAVRRDLCAGPRRTDGGVWAFNASRHRAAELRDRTCPALQV